MNDFTFTPLGDQAIVMDFGEGISIEKNKRILAWYHSLLANPFPGFVEAVPAYTTFTVYYDPLAMNVTCPYDSVKETLLQLPINSHLAESASRMIEIPVCYEQPYALDLEYVARFHHLSEEDVVRIHSGSEYDVYFIGFSPGFPYLGGMSETIATPRQSSPRLNVPRGSVGIAGSQTGIYSLDTPGGWQIIGRTPLSLFQVHSSPPSRILPGDKIRFTPITLKEYRKLEENEWAF